MSTKKALLAITLFVGLAVYAPASTWYVATNGNNGNSCTSSGSPCLTINGAYQKSGLVGGDVIELSAGSYGSQSISPRSPMPTQHVIVKPATGAAVTIGTLTINGADYLEFQNMTTGNLVIPYNVGTSWITFRNINTPYLDWGGGAHIYMYGGSVGPAEDVASHISPGNQVWPAGEGFDYIIDGVTFHDYTMSAVGVHMECLQINGANDLTIRNSTFKNCAVYNISFTDFGATGSITNLLVENNFFDTSRDVNSSCCTAYAINISHIDSGVFRFNTSQQPFQMNSPTFQDESALAFIGNIWQVDSSFTCSFFDTSKFHYNVTYPAKCGATDVQVANFSALQTVNAATTNLHLTSSSPAINVVPTSVTGGCPSSDIDGQARPISANCDAGADEFGSVSAPSAPTITGITVQ
jgi:hypothetical protein